MLIPGFLANDFNMLLPPEQLTIKSKSKSSVVTRSGPSLVIRMSFKMNLTRSDLQRKPGNCFTVTVLVKKALNQF